MNTLMPIAHASHWIEGALYLAPVLVLAVVLLLSGRRGDEEQLVEASDAPASDASDDPVRSSQP
jgi:hypothetical protein